MSYFYRITWLIVIIDSNFRTQLTNLVYINLDPHGKHGNVRICLFVCLFVCLSIYIFVVIVCLFCLNCMSVMQVLVPFLVLPIIQPAP